MPCGLSLPFNYNWSWIIMMAITIAAAAGGARRTDSANRILPRVRVPAATAAPLADPPSSAKSAAARNRALLDIVLLENDGNKTSAGPEVGSASSSSSSSASSSISGSGVGLRRTKIHGLFMPVGTIAETEGCLRQIHPCANERGRRIHPCRSGRGQGQGHHDNDWIAFYKLEDPDAEHRSACGPVLDKARYALADGAMAVIFDVTDDEDAARQLRRNGSVRFDKPVLLVHQRQASRLRKIVQYNQDAFIYIRIISRPSNNTTAHSPAPEDAVDGEGEDEDEDGNREWKDYYSLVIFVAALLLIGLLSTVVVMKVRWRMRRRESWLVRSTRDILNKMPVIFHHESSSSSSSEENPFIREDACVICLDRYSFGQEIRVLPCCHRFHKTCADPWLLANRTCPLCLFNIMDLRQSGKRSLCTTTTTTTADEQLLRQQHYHCHDNCPSPYHQRQQQSSNNIAIVSDRCHADVPNVARQPPRHNDASRSDPLTACPSNFSSPFLVNGPAPYFRPGCYWGGIEERRHSTYVFGSEGPPAGVSQWKGVTGHNRWSSGMNSEICLFGRGDGFREDHGGCSGVHDGSSSGGLLLPPGLWKSSPSSAARVYRHVRRLRDVRRCIQPLTVVKEMSSRVLDGHDAGGDADVSSASTDSVGSNDKSSTSTISEEEGCLCSDRSTAGSSVVAGDDVVASCDDRYYKDSAAASTATLPPVRLKPACLRDACDNQVVTRLVRPATGLNCAVCKTERDDVATTRCRHANDALILRSAASGRCDTEEQAGQNRIADIDATRFNSVVETTRTPFVASRPERRGETDSEASRDVVVICDVCHGSSDDACHGKSLQDVTNASRTVLQRTSSR